MPSKVILIVIEFIFLGINMFWAQAARAKMSLSRAQNAQNIFMPANINSWRFPFDQIFRFDIPGILCDEWNSIFQFVGLTNPRSSGSKFRAKIRDQTEGSFTFVYLACVASVPVRKKSSQTIFRKQAARKLGREIEGTLARRPPIFEKPVRPRTGASDWCGIVTMIDR